MGSGSGKTKKKGTQQQNENNLQAKKLDKVKSEKIYDDDVVDAANIAIAIQREDLTTNIEMFLNCEGLPKLDAFSLSDPMIVVYIEQNEKWVELGKTEVIPESLNPKFVKTFAVQYNIEKKQKLRFDVYDVDDFETKDILGDQELIGMVECDLHDIVCSPTQSISRTIINKKSNRKRNGILHIKGNEFDIGANKYFFRLGAVGFANRGDIQVRINYVTEAKDVIPVYVTDAEKNQKKQMVQWKDFFLPVSKFGNDDSANLKLEVESFNKSKGSTLLGEIEISLSQMMDSNGKSLRMMKNGIQTGFLKLIEVKQHKRYSFLNYIYSGSKIQLMLAIDFTNSQKTSNTKSSDESNDYIDALKQICGVMQYFNTDYKFAMYGFGAKLPPFYNIVSHCFACSGNIFDPFIYGGVNEVIRIYQQNQSAVKLHGPAVFSQVIEEAIAFASNEKFDEFNQKYFVLIILTDGNLNDMQLTIDTLFVAQSVPLSVVLVGIGNYDFKQLRILDADDAQLQSKTHKQNVERNIVQFLEYNKHRDNLERLTKEILGEIPKQFLEYMENHKIVPQKMKKINKAASSEFVHGKIEEVRKLKRREGQATGKLPYFLIQKKQNFIKQLIMLGYNEQYVRAIINEGIPSTDINLVIELISEMAKNDKLQNQPTGMQFNKVNFRNDIDPEIVKKLKNSDFHIGHRVFRIQQKNKLDEILQLKQEDSHLITKQFLTNLQSTKNEVIKIKYPKLQIITENIDNPQQEVQISTNTHTTEKLLIFKNQQTSQKKALENTELNQFSIKENLCLECHNNGIRLMFMPCGHACLCVECYVEQIWEKCLSCNNKIQNILNFSNQYQ